MGKKIQSVVRVTKKKAGGAEFDRKPLEFAETGQKYALVTKMLGGCRIECKLYGGGSIPNGGKGGNTGNEGVGGVTWYGK